MATLEQYRMSIENLIKEYSDYKPSYGEIEVQMLFDRERDHYQLLNVGWDDEERVCDCVLHLDLKEGKIWIQHDGTEEGIAEELVALGVHRQDIVLGFQPLYKRKYTEFAVA